MRILIGLIALVVFISSGSALSCAWSPDKATFHCPEGDCQEDVNSSNSDSLKYSIRGEKIPEPGSSTQKNKTVRDRETVRLEIRSTDSGEIPSAEQALSDSKALCSPGEKLHLYAKNSFEKESLKDTTNCYTTKIESLEDYFLVQRKGTTAPLLCVQKTRGQMVSGGETHYAAPINPWWILQAISFLIPLYSASTEQRFELFL